MTPLWADAPISSRAEDEFGRAEYAARTVQLIASAHSWDESVVFGLTGSWGSGKSSMLAMIEEVLRSEHTDWKVAHFTPWATSSVSGLLGDLYATLGESLPKSHAKQVRESLAVLADTTAVVVDEIPMGGKVAGAVFRKGGARLGRHKPVRDALEDARVKFRELNTPLLVVADDIDRLQPDELLTLLKVVRLLGRFPGVHYLLAYDEATILSVLGTSAVGDGAAARFMEKIVQYPLVLPAVPRKQLSVRIEEGISDALRVAGRPQFAVGRMSDLEDVFLAVLPTPRAVGRFLGQLRHYIPLLAGGEVNDEDVVVLALVRAAFPVLYSALPLMHKQLVNDHVAEVVGSSAENLQPSEIDGLLARLPVADQPHAARLLHDLFPGLLRSGSASGWRPRRPRGVSDAAYFERYFTMTIPAGDVSDVEVMRLVESVRTGDGADLRASLLEKGGRSEIVLDKAVTYCETLGDDDELRFALIDLLVPLTSMFPADSAVFTSARGRVSGWVVDLLMQLSDEAPADKVVAAIAKYPTLIDRAALVLRTSRRDSAKPRWFTDVASYFAGPIAQAFVAHVSERDSASPDDEPGWMITYLYELEYGSVARREIGKGLDDARFAVEDLAARFVTVDRTYDDHARLGTSRRDEFAVLAPSVDDDWYRLPMAEVDPEDVSWENRRLGARGRFSRPELPPP